jgi:hypothetical protein
MHRIDRKIAEKIIGDDEYSKKAIDLILKNSRNGIIKLKSLNSDDFEVFLTLTHFKLALPLNSINDSLSWNSRILSSNTSKLEIPNIIRFIFSEISEKGEAKLEDAIIRYFKKIGEKNAEDFVKIVQKIFGEVENFLVCGNTITKICHKYGRDGGVVISELKGAGIISPFSGCGNSFQAYGKRYGSPVYEVNRFIYEVLKVDQVKVDQVRSI